MESIFELDPNSRLTMSEIIAHPWMNKECPTQSQINSEFASRNLKNNQVKQ
jgi:serine/threonine protein kinase